MAELRGQISMFIDNPEYEAFTQKFEPKKTTDDCYTPAQVYEAVVSAEQRKSHLGSPHAPSYVRGGKW